MQQRGPCDLADELEQMPPEARLRQWFLHAEFCLKKPLLEVRLWRRLLQFVSHVTRILLLHVVFCPMRSGSVALVLLAGLPWAAALLRSVCSAMARSPKQA